MGIINLPEYNLVWELVGNFVGELFHKLVSELLYIVAGEQIGNFV
jgi:hypothetical protein